MICNRRFEYCADAHALTSLTVLQTRERECNQVTCNSDKLYLILTGH